MIYVVKRTDERVGNVSVQGGMLVVGRCGTIECLAHRAFVEARPVVVVHDTRLVAGT